VEKLATHIIKEATPQRSIGVIAFSFHKRIDKQNIALTPEGAALLFIGNQYRRDYALMYGLSVADVELCSQSFAALATYKPFE
jgi:hypothetical protein